MDQLARTDRLIAVPQSKARDIYDVYSLRVNTPGLVLYDAFDQLYEQERMAELISLSTSDAVENIVELLPDDAVERWEVISLGVSKERFDKMAQLDYLLAHAIYVINRTQFKAYYPLWLGVDIGEHVLQTADGQHVIWEYEKNKTTRNRHDFMQNLDTVARNNANTHINILEDEVPWDASRALLTASARCNSDRADYWNGDSRFAVGETDDKWMIIKYHSDWGANTNAEGILLQLPTTDKETFNSTYEQIMRGTENGRLEMYDRFRRQNQFSNAVKANQVFRNHVVNQFETLLPDFFES